MKLLHVIALLPPLPLRAAGGFFVTSNYRTEPSQPWAATQSPCWWSMGSMRAFVSLLRELLTARLCQRGAVVVGRRERGVRRQ